LKSRPPASQAPGICAWAAALFAVLALAALPAAATAAAGWTPSTDIADTASVAGLDVALDSAGNAVLVGASRNNAVAASRAPDGQWSALHTLSTWGSNPRVSFAPDGKAVAVWEKTSAQFEYEVWTADRDAAGSWSEPKMLSSADASVQPTRPTIAIDRAGNATVAWAQNCSVYSARRPANGEWSAPTAVWTDPAPAELSEPCANYRLEPGLGQVFGQAVLDIGVDAPGNVTVVWRSGKRSSTTALKTIRAAVRPAGGSSVWSEARTIAPAALKPRPPRIEVWEDGRAIVTWGIDTLGARAAVRPAGADRPFGAPETLSETGSPDPVAAYDGHGNANVAWEAPGAGAESATLQAQTLGVGGSWGAVETAASLEPGTEAMNPRLVLSQGGDATLAWIRKQEDERVAQTARRAGDSWEAATTHGEEVAGDSFPVPALAGDALGNAVLAWTGDGTWMGFPSGVARTADYAAAPRSRADWTANGLVGSGNLHSWIDYISNGGGGVEASAGATRPEPDDRYSYRLALTDAWIEQSTGEPVLQLQGAIRFSMPGHFIDIRIVDPKIAIAADGKTARVVADGQGSGDMAEALKGNPKVEPFTGLHLLDLTLPPALVSRDGTVRSWIAAAAKIAPGEASRHLSYPAGSAYGLFTFSAPATLPVRDTRPPEPLFPGPGPEPEPTPGPSPGASPQATPAAPAAAKPKPKHKGKRKALICKKGQKKVRVKGKKRCVKKKGAKAKRSGAKGKRAGAGKR
jgi:hypothetical protein